jgi:hypothetical protein
LSQYLLWLIRSARRGTFPLQLPTFIRAGDRRLRVVVRRALRAPVRRLLRGATPVKIFLHFFAAAAKARRADFGVVNLVRLIAATMHFLSAPLPPFTPFDVLHTHLFPPTILVTVLRVVLRFLPLFLRTISIHSRAITGVICVGSYGISCCLCGVRTCTCVRLCDLHGAFCRPCVRLPWSSSCGSVYVPF